MGVLNAIPYSSIETDTRSTAPGESRDKFQRSGYVIIATASVVLALATAQECHSITHLPSIYYGIVLWGWWGVIAARLWRAVPGGLSGTSTSFVAIAVQIIIGVILASIHLMLLGSLSFVVPEWRKPAPVLGTLTGLFQLNRFGLEILIYGFIVGLLGTIQSQRRAQKEAMSAIELQRQLATAQLKALQMQLEPHFLFNTLNAITTLVELGKQREAAEMLGHLNAILKTTLDRRSPEKVRLSQELEIVENYLAIEQVRFADRLRIDIKIDPSALQSLVPCFLLQPIVENAIRHGIAHCEDEGVIEALARREGDRLRIAVRNHGTTSREQAKPGTGIGLKNTRERLAYFYPQEYRMHAGPLCSGGFEVAIDVPYERAV